MTWRTVVISGTAKLDYKLNAMMVRQNEKTTQIHLGEIGTLLLENTAISLTASLLCELMHRKVKVIFCDEKRNPQAELIPYYGCHDTSAKIRAQIRWSSDTKELVWGEIVAEKIRNQRNFLRRLGKQQAALLDGYVQNIAPGDVSNREGHAAKVYFNALFGTSFTRASVCPINAALNYGYSILLSAFNREIVAGGYITPLGIFHDNVNNPFNFSCDLMEPFRILVDQKVHALEVEAFGKEEKLQLVDILNQEVLIQGKRQDVSNAIKIYAHSVFEALEGKDISLIAFYQDEL